MANFRSLSLGWKCKPQNDEPQLPTKTFLDNEREIFNGIDTWLQCKILPSYTMTISRCKGLPAKPTEVEECEHLIHVLEEGILDMEILELRDRDRMRRELLISQANVMAEVLREHLDTFTIGSMEEVLQALRDQGVELPLDLLEATQHRSSTVETSKHFPTRKEEARDIIAIAMGVKSYVT